MTTSHILDRAKPALLFGGLWRLVIDGYGPLLGVAHGMAVLVRPTLLAVETLRDVPAPGSDTLNLARLLLITPNLLLTFAEPVEAEGPYGFRRAA